MRWTLARMVGLLTAYFGISLLERIAYAAAAEAAEARLAAHAADDALFSHLTGDCAAEAAEAAESVGEQSPC